MYQHGLIDTIIILWKAGDKIFGFNMNKFEPNHLGNEIDPDYFAADAQDELFLANWSEAKVLHELKFSRLGKFAESLVREFYFNQFSLLDKDSASAYNYFLKVIL